MLTEILLIILFVIFIFWFAAKLEKWIQKELNLTELPPNTRCLVFFSTLGITSSVVGCLQLLAKGLLFVATLL